MLLNIYPVAKNAFYFLFLAALLGLLYYNRKALLYENGKLSLGRIWGWVAFSIAVSFWIRTLLGITAPGTPFPPVLEEFLYVCLMYNFAKQGNKTAERIADLWSTRKFEHGNRNWKGSEPNNWDEEKPKVREKDGEF